MTLLEVLISMLLLCLLAAGIFATFALLGRKPGRLGRVEIEGVNFARETLEKLRNAVSINPVQSAPLNAGTNRPDPLPAGYFRDTCGGTRSYDVEDIDPDNDGEYEYKRVTVTVRWND